MSSPAMPKTHAALAYKVFVAPVTKTYNRCSNIHRTFVLQIYFLIQ